MKNINWLIISALLLTACDKKIPLPGKREAISGITSANNISVNTATSKLKVDISPPQSLDSFVDVQGNKQHVAFNHKMSSNPKLIWETSIRGNYINSNVIAFDGNVYAIDVSGTLHCIKQNTGQIVWKKKLTIQPQDSVFAGGITAGNGILYIGTNLGSVIAINSNTQKELWKSNLKYPIKSMPLYIAGKVIVTSVDNQTFAIDVRDGKTVWTKTMTSEQARINETSVPAAFQDNVICAYSSGDIVKLNHNNGGDSWSGTL
ncbi:MAG: PQQ-binding-like beta-propeller repeat protein, partial [Holosporales bacterium]|nr:PQQ-binding-like beta-propeller repeat protein [Holosporales bacterium]